MGTSYNPKIVTSGLVIYYDSANYKSYIGSGSSWTDLTKSKINSTLYNSPSYSNGKLTFTKVSTQYAETNVSLSSYSTWTAEGWVYFNSIPVSGTDVSAIVTGLFDGVNKVNFTLGVTGVPADGLIRAGFFNGVWRHTSGHQPVINRWYQYVGTYDGSTISLYVNGILFTSMSYSGTPQSGGAMRIARRWDSAATSANFIDGIIPIARLYNRALSSNEVFQNYNATKGRFGL